MSPENDNGSRKRSYSKPQMTRVKLVAEEAVFAGCKTYDSGSASGASGRCNGGGWGGTTPCDEMRS